MSSKFSDGQDEQTAHSPQPTAHEVAPGCSLDRRGFMQRSAATGAAIAMAATGGTYAMSDRAEAATGVIYGFGSVGLTSYLFGSDTDEDEIEEAEANELHDRVYADALEAEGDIIDHYESGLNNVTLLAEHVRTNVAFTIAEAADLGQDKEDVIEAAKDEAAETIAGFQERHLQRWERDALAFSRRYSLVLEEDGLDFQDVFAFVDQEDNFADPDSAQVYDGNSEDRITGWKDSTEDYFARSLVDGSSIDIPATTNYDPDRSDGWTFLDPASPDEYEEDELIGTDAITEIQVYNREGSGRATMLSATRYMEVFGEFEDLYEDEAAHAEQLVESLYDAIVDGEVNAHEIASGSAILEASEDPDHYGEAAGVYRAVNMPEADAPAVVEIDGVRLEGILFWTLPSDDGFPIGEQVQPSGQLGDIYMAAEVTEVDDEIGDDLDDGDEEDDLDDGDEEDDLDDGDEEDSTEEIDEDDEGDVVTVRLTEPFEITGVHEWSGDNLTFDSRELIDPDEDDHEALIEALRDAYDQEQQTREERQEIIIEQGDAEIDVGLPGLNDFGEGAGYLGLGLIGVVVLAVIGIVTDLIPGLGD